VTRGHVNEVRRCARCGAAALVCVRDWQHKIMGIAPGAWTLELECQSCGAEVTLLPQQEARMERLLAFVMLPAIIPSIFLFASARRKARAWSDNPVVDGASAPSPRRAEPGRACAACRGVAHPSEIGRQQGLGISIGTHTRYTCSGCANEFAVHDRRAVAFAFAAAIVLSAMGALVVAFPPGSDVGAELSNRWFGVGLLAVAAIAWVILVLRIRARRAHPNVE
jgi:hypothetical protein